MGSLEVSRMCYLVEETIRNSSTFELVSDANGTLGLGNFIARDSGPNSVGTGRYVLIQVRELADVLGTVPVAHSESHGHMGDKQW